MGPPTAAISFARRSAKTLFGSRSQASAPGIRDTELITNRRTKPLRKIQLIFFIFNLAGLRHATVRKRRASLKETYHAGRNFSPCRHSERSEESLFLG